MRSINRAILAAARQDPAAAARAARAALKLAPDHPEALKQLGLALANGTGDLDGALAAFRRLRRLLPPDRATELDGVLTHLVALGARPAVAGAHMRLALLGKN